MEWQSVKTIPPQTPVLLAWPHDGDWRIAAGFYDDDANFDKPWTFLDPEYVMGIDSTDTAPLLWCPLQKPGFKPG